MKDDGALDPFHAGLFSADGMMLLARHPATWSSSFKVILHAVFSVCIM